MIFTQEGNIMTNVIEIEKAVQSLPPDDLKKFQQWYSEFFQDQWDEEIEEDIKAGRLDRLAEEALSDYKANKTTEL